jgi:uncharacterized membrane protein
VLAIPLAVCAALCNALTTIFQRLGVETAPPSAERGLKLIGYVIKRPIWYVGLAAMLGSFLFQATALGFGGLSVVQPLMVSELVFLVLILRVWFGIPLGWREAIGTVATVAGLAGFLALSNAGGGTTFPTTSGWVIVICACAGAVSICLACTRLGTSRGAEPRAGEADRDRGGRPGSDLPPRSRSRSARLLRRRRRSCSRRAFGRSFLTGSLTGSS